MSQVEANHKAADAKLDKGLAEHRAAAEKKIADMYAAHDIYEQTQEAKIKFHYNET